MNSAELQRLAWQVNEDNDLPDMLLPAVAQVESNWDPRAKSPAGALGLTQVTPITAREIGVPHASLTNPEKSLSAGAKYLKWLYDKLGGDIDKTLAAYNRGPYAKGALPAETRKYIPKVKAAMKKMQDPYYLAPMKRPGMDYEVTPEELVSRALGKRPALLEDTSPVKLKPSQSLNTYVVKPGDNLTNIAKKLGVSLASLLTNNSFEDPNKIKPGQVLHY